jgi:hypothetical protein
MGNPRRHLLYFNWYLQEADMKMSSIISLALFLFFGSALQTPAQMTPQEQATAKKEIGEVVNAIFQNLEKMDIETLFQSYSSSPDFILITTVGSMVDYQAAKNHHAEWFKALSSLNVTTVREEFRFLPGNIVICSWQGKFDMTIKAGAQVKIEPFGITFVFSRIGDHWSVIYQHSSALPPVLESPK